MHVPHKVFQFLSVSFLVFGLVSYAAGSPFQLELSASLGEIELDQEKVADSSSYELKIFFDSIDSSKGPLDEAGFLDKGSFLNLVQAEVSNHSNDLDEKYTIAESRIVLNSGLIFELGRNDSKFERNTMLGFGTYLNTNTDLVFKYRELGKSDTKIYSAKVYSVKSDKTKQALAMNAGLERWDFPDTSGVAAVAGATYYPAPTLGFGANISMLTLDVVEDEENEIRRGELYLHYYIFPSLKLLVNYESETVNPQNITTESLMLGASLRF